MEQENDQLKKELESLQDENDDTPQTPNNGESLDKVVAYAEVIANPISNNSNKSLTLLNQSPTSNDTKRLFAQSKSQVMNPLQPHDPTAEILAKNENIDKQLSKLSADELLNLAGDLFK